MVIATTENKLAVDEYQLIASICKESFFEFVKEFWDTIIPETYIHNWHIEVLCNELQIAAMRVFAGLPCLYDIIINISPGTTKSTIATEMLPAWSWACMPSCRLIGGSHGSSLSMDLSRRNRQIIKSEKYQRCFPDIRLSRDQDSKSYFINTRGGSRFAVGVGGSVVGMHGHILIIDDPIDPKGAVSETELATANRWMDETLATRKVDKLVSLTILIMQRLHQNDPTANMLKKTARVKHICFPAELSDKIQPKHFASFYKDGLMDPVRLSREILADNAKKLGQYGFSGQFGQDPVPLGGGMFKTERIKIGVAPEKNWKGIIRSWDKAATLDGGAYTAGVKIGVDQKDRVWILNVKRGQWDTDVREEHTKSTAIVDGKKVEILLEQEPGSGGVDSVKATVRNLLGFIVRVVRPTGDKVHRADPFSVQVNIGNVYMVEGPWNEDFLDEMKFFPLSKYKDQIDAASAGFNFIAGSRTRVGALQ